jgi:hypothetical protein
MVASRSLPSLRTTPLTPLKAPLVTKPFVAVGLVSGTPPQTSGSSMPRWIWWFLNFE